MLGPVLAGGAWARQHENRNGIKETGCGSYGCYHRPAMAMRRQPPDASGGATQSNVDATRPIPYGLPLQICSQSIEEAIKEDRC
jgi:hypothetical protein